MIRSLHGFEFLNFRISKFVSVLQVLQIDEFLVCRNNKGCSPQVLSILLWEPGGTFGRVYVPLRLKNQSLYHKMVLLQKFNDIGGKVLKPKKIQPPTSKK